MAKRIIWFEPSEQALADPVRFVAYAARYALIADLKLLRNFVNDQQFLHALRHAPPGIIDPRSWSYCHVMLGVEVPPLPERNLELANVSNVLGDAQ
jgi:hypothetical protein